VSKELEAHFIVAGDVRKFRFRPPASSTVSTAAFQTMAGVLATMLNMPRQESREADEALTLRTEGELAQAFGHRRYGSFGEIASAWTRAVAQIVKDVPDAVRQEATLRNVGRLATFRFGKHVPAMFKQLLLDDADKHGLHKEQVLFSLDRDPSQGRFKPRPKAQVEPGSTGR
jgi:hypothetical protein